MQLNQIHYLYSISYDVYSHVSPLQDSEDQAPEQTAADQAPPGNYISELPPWQTKLPTKQNNKLNNASVVTQDASSVPHITSENQNSNDSPTLTDQINDNIPQKDSENQNPADSTIEATQITNTCQPNYSENQNSAVQSGKTKSVQSKNSKNALEIIKPNDIVVALAIETISVPKVQELLGTFSEDGVENQSQIKPNSENAQQNSININNTETKDGYILRKSLEINDDIPDSTFVPQQNDDLIVEKPCRISVDFEGTSRNALFLFEMLCFGYSIAVQPMKGFKYQTSVMFALFAKYFAA